ncbi:K02A2.6-like [Cordylochernes scorpioides]|uniref:RNA-directed DNA polymerase n=1 Tax=Cordylochernes scorpioides TaxID=51811 RepID=A0ABY6LP28_9ARAC|nr:K02A2.6-like [Cordylochernes scorpioides]
MQACPRGYRSSEFSICEPCLDFPSAYDIRYLGFMALMLLVLEWYIIDLTTERQALSKKVLALHGSALLENILAMLLTVLLTAPVGSLDIHACRISYLADWYTLLYNPSPGYQHTLRCANEAAYPLYSMVFIHLSLCLLLMLVIRAGILARYISRAKQSVYLTMYLVPSLLLVHAVFAGLLYVGFTKKIGKFIPNLSDKTAPLRKLISNKSEWKFGGEENDCFEKLKNMVSNAPILTFFDPTKPITISSDASQYGIGTVLMQGGHAIEYASFSLNATQRKFAQIEKELLAIVFGCERFQYYIWGNDVIVETDHKPLLSIVKKPLEKLSPRLQRMVLRLMRFQISLKFTPGKNMFVADHLSRDPLKDEVDTSYLEGQTESVHMLLVTTDEKIKRLQKETHGDHTLIQLIEYAKNGWPKYKTKVCDEAKPYWQFQDEIHVSDGIVYKVNCIMVPSTLRKEILQVVHSSHQGIAASKEKARSAFYWKGMITQVENEVEKCRTCQEYSRKNPEESRIAHEIPEFPWEKIAVDFMEVSGTSSILVVDYHSKFVEIRKLSSKRETETIKQLKTIFRTHGIPRTLVSNNGPPFNSTGFKNFAQKYEFKHQTSSPKYPRSNGQVERTIQTIKGLIIKAVKSGRDPNLALMEFNNTPKYDLPSPTQMLMGRSVRTLSTYTRQQLKPLFDTTKNYQKLKDHQQKYAGSPKRILRPLEVGDNIMLQERHRKWVPATVTAKHETPRSYMVKTPSGSEYRRNRSHLRPRKFSVEDSAPTSQSPSIPGSQAGTAMDDNIQDHGRPTSENRRAYDPRENVAKKDYTFPFILIISSVISVAYHLAFRLDQQIKSLVKQSVEDPRNFIIILIHWLLHGYGIGALTQHPALHALVPLPTIFYILTSRYTDPTKLHDD